MAIWRTPVTDRVAGAMMTYIDMDRISGNIDWLTEQFGARGMYIGSRPSQTDWTHNDYVTLGQWQELLHILEVLVDVTNLQQVTPGTEETTYQNINNVEDLTLRLRERLDIIDTYGELPHYVDTEVWTGDDVYIGGVQDIKENPYRRIRHYCDTEIYAGDLANCGGVE